MNISNTTLIVLLILSFATTVFSLFMIYRLKVKLGQKDERHQDEMNRISQEQTTKLFSHSKYSELGMMSAGIAHEINNPLAVIQARATQLLRIYKQPDRYQDLADGLQQILYTSERINRTIQGIREFVHHNDNLPDTEVNVKELVEDVLAFCGQRMKNHGVNLRFYNIDNHRVFGNKVQLEQILLNLLNNSFDAIEYLSEKWIEISCKEDGDRLKILVKDSGPGIPSEIAERIMEPFFFNEGFGQGDWSGAGTSARNCRKARREFVL